MDHQTTTLPREHQPPPSHGQRRAVLSPEPVHVLISTTPDGVRVMQTRTAGSFTYGPEIPVLSLLEVHEVATLAGEVPC